MAEEDTKVLRVQLYEERGETSCFIFAEIDGSGNLIFSGS